MTAFLLKVVALMIALAVHQCRGQLELLGKLEENLEQIRGGRDGRLLFPLTRMYYNNINPYDTLSDEYDFIVVGSGSAGSVLANRLSEVPDWRVLLLECGDVPPYIIEMPAIAASYQFTNFSWNYVTERQEKINLGMIDERMAWPRGRGLGGSTLINYMIATRGHRQDYDRWAANGNPGWSYDEVLPYFKKLENARARRQDFEERGHRGPVTVEDINSRSKLAETFVSAAQEKGYDFVDYNGNRTGQANVVSYIQGTVRNGHRCSTEKAYLRPAQRRPNLTILTKARVLKVLIDPESKRAYGVEYAKDRRLRVAKATKEVVLSAGAFNSPQLLMLSGVGPQDHLQELGIPVIKDLPVGQTLYDHITFIGMTYVINDTAATVHTHQLYDPLNMLQFIKTGTGPMTNLGGIEAIAYYRSSESRDPDPSYPDMELLFLGGQMHEDEGLIYRKSFRITDRVYDAVWKPIEGKSAWTIMPMLVHPKSKGRLRLKSTNPFHWPKFYGNYFTDPEDSDIKTFIASIREVQRIAASDQFKTYGSCLLKTPIPGCETMEFDSDAYWECALRHVTPTLHHQVATCKMGPETDPEAVVDSRLRVYGIRNLRVADTSVIPHPLTAHTNLPTIMVGEKLADMLKEDWKRNATDGCNCNNNAQ